MSLFAYLLSIHIYLHIMYDVLHISYGIHCQRSLNSLQRMVTTYIYFTYFFNFAGSCQHKRLRTIFFLKLLLLISLICSDGAVIAASIMTKG